jgi:hypothetical protein
MKFSPMIPALRLNSRHRADFGLAVGETFCAGLDVREVMTAAGLPYPS